MEKPKNRKELVKALISTNLTEEEHDELLEMLIDNPISVEELKHMATEFFGDMVKAVVDIDRGKLAINSELHSDLERLLLEDGSEQEFLWGINLYPEYIGTDDFIEFDSLINIRPWQNNRSRYVEDEHIREQITGIVIRYFK